MVFLTSPIVVWNSSASSWRRARSESVRRRCSSTRALVCCFSCRHKDSSLLPLFKVCCSSACLPFRSFSVAPTSCCRFKAWPVRFSASSCSCCSFSQKRCTLSASDSSELFRVCLASFVLFLAAARALPFCAFCVFSLSSAQLCSNSRIFFCNKSATSADRAAGCFSSGSAFRGMPALPGCRLAGCQLGFRIGLITSQEDIAA
mmetsp:Transcript_73915/g.128183  ORF Transcript_73915/g.128183 Transcript_73915/m.128183 type:complete len:203 (-) Transcript_73915:10-618(-)